MRKVRGTVVMILLAVMLAPSLTSAQSGQTAGSQSLTAIAAEHAAKKQADRQAILNVLQRDDVRKVAKEAGLPIDRAAAAVGTLDGAELAQVAAQAQQVTDALAGGQTITLSVWLIIIALLIIILVIVA
ncbi:MAG: PA2779 family protein [Vicinamibacterales bacterium]